MKKTVLFKSISTLLALVLICLSFSSCAVKVQNSSFYADYSFIDKLTFLSVSGEKINKFSGTDGDYFDIKLSSPVTVDTVVLKEKGNNIQDYEIFVKQNGEFVSIYEQDLVGKFRYCAFSDTVTDELRVKINKTTSGHFALSSIDVLNSKHKEEFKITTYLIADRAYDINTLDSKHFDVITDVILFGTATFDENGDITLAEADIDGTKVSGEEILNKAISNIKEVSQGKDINIYINILGPGSDDSNEKQRLHTQCFKEYDEKLITNILQLIAMFDADGIFFDYEFPYAAKHMNAFSDFLVKLNKTMDNELPGDKAIGVALAPWGKSLSDKAKDAVDFVEIMAYDLFDDNGYHSTFASQGGAFSLDYFNNKKYDISKCDLGVPFYARPVDKDAVWLDYKSAYETLGKFGNVDERTVYVDNEHPEYSVARYYNSYQMVFDKTAFAYDYGVSGMMVWHYSCDATVDTGLSLFDAMAKAVESRQN